MPGLDKDLEAAVARIVDVWNKDPSTANFSHALQLLNLLLQSLVPQIENQRYPVTVSNSSSGSGSKLLKFVKLQDVFRFNLVLTMSRYLDWIYDNINDLDTELVTQYNSLMQGLLLIHSQSRSVFSNSTDIRRILRFINLENEHVAYEITISFIATLLHILLKNLNNFRIFEECNGCSIVIQKLKISDFSVPEKSIENNHSSQKTANQQMLNFKVIEFLIFYLSDEANLFDDSDKKKTLKEKSDHFREDFPDIDNLISSLNSLKNI